MKADEVVVVLCIIMIASAIKKIIRQRRRQRRWVRAWIRRRQQHGAHHALMVELTTEDPGGFRNLLRMNEIDFEELLEKMTPVIKIQYTWMREAISASERLSITLRFLGTDHLTCRRGWGLCFFFVPIFFSDNTRVRLSFLCRAKREIFFPEFNIRLYDKNSESDFFFSPPKSEYFI